MKRLLIVDDEPDVLASLRRALKEAPTDWETVFGVAGFREILMRGPGQAEDGFPVRRVGQNHPDHLRILLPGNRQ